MPRQMPPYAAWFQQRVDEAIRIARAGDLVIASNPVGTPLRREWHFSRVELLYELAYLRIFLEWETYLQETFVRYLCGYRSARGMCAPIAGTQYRADLSSAESDVLRGRDYVLWHDPAKIIARAQNFFAASFYDTVIASNTSRLAQLAAIRHRIAHGQENARAKFDAATIGIVGKRYRGARPGRFLRDWDSSVHPPMRWLESLGSEFVQMANQIGHLDLPV